MKTSKRNTFHKGSRQSNDSTLKVALIANLKDEFIPEEDDPPDAGAEFDQVETILHITRALETDGHKVHFINADDRLPSALIRLKPDICFNIAEGIRGDSREAQVPALCELLGIPYTASRVLANAISLDKPITKRIWRDNGLPTAPFQEINQLEDLENLELNFPLFVKPAREGTGMGIDEGSLVHNFDQLYTRMSWLLDQYRQPGLIEEFLPGREFTVGFIGNPGSPEGRRHPEIYDSTGYHWFPVMEIGLTSSVSPTVYGHESKSINIGDPGAPAYLCPADIPESLVEQLTELTRKAAEVLNVCDISRVDFRIGADDQPYLLEINTLPGLNPAISDLCIMAEAEGLEYSTLILEVLYLAAERFGLELPVGKVSTRKINIFNYSLLNITPEITGWAAKKGKLQ